MDLLQNETIVRKWKQKLEFSFHFAMNVFLSQSFLQTIGLVMIQHKLQVWRPS